MRSLRRRLGLPTSRQVIDRFDFHTGRAKYLLVHIPKNAGSAVKATRSLKHKMIPVSPGFFAEPGYWHDLRTTFPGTPNPVHARLRDVHQTVRQRLTPVAVIRNPFARVVSRYLFKATADDLRGRPADRSVEGFVAFLELRHEFGDQPFNWHRAVNGWVPQSDYVDDPGDGQPIILLRQEHLAEELAEALGVTDLAVRNVSNTEKQDYRSFYTDETQAIVADWYQSDIERFGFDFSGGATRNTHFTPSEG